MRRDVPKERVFFAVVLGVSLLLLSVAMLRSDMASAPSSTRTFRDGFIVADRVTRRTETASPADVAVETVTGNNKNGPPQILRKSSSDNEKAGGAGVPASAPAAAAAIHVSGDSAHTTTIKMEGGDEITIKRAGTSKNKITTISTHEDGKITIENRDKQTKDPKVVAIGGDDASIPQPKEKGTSNNDTVVAAAIAKKDTDKQQQQLTATGEIEKTRAVDFVGAYEEKDGDAVLTEAGADEETSERAAATAAAEDSEETGDNTHEIVVGKKKVTVVNVGRSQTKVSLSNVEDDEEEKGKASEKLQTSGR